MPKASVPHHQRRIEVIVRLRGMHPGGKRSKTEVYDVFHLLSRSAN